MNFVKLHTINKNSTIIITSAKDTKEDMRLEQIKENEYILYISKNVSSISGLFEGMLNINKIIFDNWDSSNIREMGYTFSNMQLEEFPDFSKQDFSNLKDISRMFSHTTIKDTFIFKNHTLNNLEYATRMFFGFSCKDFLLDIGKTKLRYAHEFCDSLTVDNNIEIIIDETNELFADNILYCTRANIINCSKFNIENGHNLMNFFRGVKCNKLYLPNYSPQGIIKHEIPNTIDEIYCNKEWRKLLKNYETI